MSKAKKSPPRPVTRPGAKPVVLNRGNKNTWVWYVVLGGVVLLGLLVILVAKGGAKSNPNGPDGTQSFDSLSRNHTTSPVQYPQTPPVGGDHDPTPQTCGIYDAPIRNENGVHSMEHGAVWVTYQPNLPSDQLQKLRSLVTANYKGSSKYILLSPYPGLDSPIVASAWGKQLKVSSADDARLASFLRAFVQGNQTPEQGAACIGTGNPIG
jgi:hypothetical protein